MQPLPEHSDSEMYPFEITLWFSPCLTHTVVGWIDAEPYVSSNTVLS